jgi:hypothetical protein
MSTVVVNDANILIDLCKLGLLPQFFMLGYQCYTTDIILEELHESQVNEYIPYIKAGRLIVLELDADELSEVLNIVIKKTQLSSQDCSAIICARKVSGDILTSDNNLRKYAQSISMVARGHLWIFDRLFENNLISGFVAIEKLELLNRNVNPRLGLPLSECEKRKANWINK